MKFPFEAEVLSVDETEQIGQRLGKYIFSNNDRNAFIAMYGDLGAGKTAFVRGLSSVLVPNAFVSSPTYALVNEYCGEYFRICHFDMYRIESDEDLYSIGFYDYDDCVKAVEWCENIPFALPGSYYKIEILKKSENSRTLRINYCN